MKKIIALVLAVLMLCSCLTACGDKKDDTKAPAQTQAPAATEEADGGCFGTIGFGAVAIVVASIAAGFVAFKKKRD